MKMRLTPPVPVPGAWLIAGRSAAGAVILAVAVSACTGGGSGSSVPSVFTPTAPTSGHSSDGGTRTPSPTGGGGSASSHEPTRSSGPSHSSGAGSASTHAPSSSSSSSHASAPASSSPHESASSHASASATPTPTHSSATPAQTHTSTPTHTSAPASTAFPTAAPETGGGGSAGLQDGLLFGVGGLAVFAGLGTLAYRRRLSGKFGLGKPDPRTRPDREPVDR